MDLSASVKVATDIRYVNVRPPAVRHFPGALTPHPRGMIDVASARVSWEPHASSERVAQTVTRG
jgi:hypothetical protein